MTAKPEDRTPAPSLPDGRPPARLTLVGNDDAATEPDMDALLLRVGRDQDRGAFEQLFQHFGPRLKGWLVRTGSAPALADDIVQDAFVILWRKARQFDPAKARTSTWLYAIARNLRVDHHRQLCDSWLSLDGLDADDPPDPAPAFDARIEERQSGDRVRDALTRLTSDQRTLVQLAFYEDKSQSLIAHETGLPLGTVKTRLRAASARLRSLLEDFRP